MRTGLNWLVISFQHNGSAKIRRYPMIVKPTSYQSFTRRVYLGDLSKPPRQLSAEELEKRRQAWKERQEKIARATAKKNAVYSRLSIDYLQNRLSHPRGLHKITSPFYVNRTIARYFKKHGRIFHKNPASIRHRGLDLRGRYGKPIYAVADGIVAIAEHMVFEGNFVVIDHGKGVFTGYMHQSKLLVSEGQRVQAGQLLGNSGNTGASAGPHLHLALFMRGTYYEPLSLLSLPIRN